jgi:rubredoxin
MTAYRCRVCEYVYDESAGAPREGVPRGPCGPRCPMWGPARTCGVREKIDFEAFSSSVRR